MLTIPAKAVYVAPDIYEKENCNRRLQRILPHIKCGSIYAYDSTAREAYRNLKQTRHGKDNFGDDAILFFTSYEDDRLGRYSFFRDKDAADQSHGGICQSAIELNLVHGCVFRCAYCGFGRYIHFSLDVERYIENLDKIFAQNPGQTLFKFSNMTDLPPFEPELDAVPPMVQRFAREENRYLMLFTKSDNVDFLLDLEHKGHTIISWSVSCESESRLIDKRTAPLSRRIEAMRKVQEAGYITRARLSPIVPVKNWRQEYAELFEQLFAVAPPDIVTLELLGWFDYDDLQEIINVDLLDQDLLTDAQKAAVELKGTPWGPYTEAAHIEVYRYCMEQVKKHSPNTPVSICHATPGIWDACSDLIAMTPDNYLCNCGPTCTPGQPLYDSFSSRR